MAASEGVVTQSGHRLRNGDHIIPTAHVLQRHTVVKRVIADAPQALPAHIHPLQRCAVQERRITDRLHTVRQRNDFDQGQFLKSRIGNGGILGDHHIPQRFRHRVENIAERVGGGHGVADKGHRDLLQRSAPECAPANGGHILRHHHFRQRRAVVERVLTNGHHARAKLHAGGIDAAIERIIADGGHAVLDHNFSDRLPAFHPRRIAGIIVGHCTAAENGQRAVVPQRPAQARTAGAARSHTLRRSRRHSQQRHTQRHQQNRP